MCYTFLRGKNKIQEKGGIYESPSDRCAPTSSPACKMGLFLLFFQGVSAFGREWGTKKTNEQEFWAGHPLVYVCVCPVNALVPSVPSYVLCVPQTFCPLN